MFTRRPVFCVASGTVNQLLGNGPLVGVLKSKRAWTVSACRRMEPAGSESGRSDTPGPGAGYKCATTVLTRELLGSGATGPLWAPAAATICVTPKPLPEPYPGQRTARPHLR